MSKMSFYEEQPVLVQNVFLWEKKGIFWKTCVAKFENSQFSKIILMITFSDVKLFFFVSQKSQFCGFMTSF